MPNLGNIFQISPFHHVKKIWKFILLKNSVFIFRITFFADPAPELRYDWDNYLYQFWLNM
jgi:hypothetical protein